MKKTQLKGKQGYGKDLHTKEYSNKQKAMMKKLKNTKHL